MSFAWILIQTNHCVQLWWNNSEHSCLPNKAFVKVKEKRKRRQGEKQEGREGVKKRGREKKRENEDPISEISLDT